VVLHVNLPSFDDRIDGIPEYFHDNPARCDPEQTWGQLDFKDSNTFAKKRERPRMCRIRTMTALNSSQSIPKVEAAIQVMLRGPVAPREQWTSRSESRSPTRPHAPPPSPRRESRKNREQDAAVKDAIEGGATRDGTKVSL
jgi:hypothetical protein